MFQTQVVDNDAVLVGAAVEVDFVGCLALAFYAGPEPDQFLVDGGFLVRRQPGVGQQGIQGLDLWGLVVGLFKDHGVVMDGSDGLPELLPILLV